MPFPPDRLQEKTFTDNKTFDSDYWSERRDHPIRMIYMFNRFLHQYNLIGMSKDKVAELLGDPDGMKGPIVFAGTFYRFPYFDCTGSFEGILISFAEDKVCSWKFIGGSSHLAFTRSESAPVTTDVVLDQPTEGTRLTNAAIGERKFPAVLPKVKK